MFVLLMIVFVSIRWLLANSMLLTWWFCIDTCAIGDRVIIFIFCCSVSEVSVFMRVYIFFLIP